MKKISKKNLLKLYVDEANGGGENKLLSFQVKNMLDAARVYYIIKGKVKKIRVAYFQNGLANGIATRMTERKANQLYKMYLELEAVNKIQSEHEKHFDSLTNDL